MHRRRLLAAIVLAFVAAFAVAAVTTITGRTTSDRVKHCAAGLTAQTAHGLADLTALFRQQQSLYLRIALPTPDFLLRQSCGTVAFDPQGFPADFLAGLVATTNNGCRVYTLVIAEDPVTRDIVFANGQGYEIQAVAAAADYDPWWLLESMYPDLDSGNYSSDQVAWLKTCYDPARVQVTVHVSQTLGRVSITS